METAASCPEEEPEEQLRPGPVLRHPKPLQQHGGNLQRDLQRPMLLSQWESGKLLRAATTCCFSGVPQNDLIPESSGPAPCPRASRLLWTLLLAQEG